ncbi:MAG TPA: FadR/GntR family transcriptional regulator [Methylomirabilota bacterium]|jgi:DNA-binding FadR family transcriptional regulator
MLSSVRPPRVYEHIVAQLERAIYEGRLQPGDKLPPERQLVRDVHASRVAVREALRILEHRGLVEVRQGSAGGHFIREVNAGLVARDFQTLFRLGRVNLNQLIEARLLIEPEMARLAALRATEVELKALRGVVEEPQSRALHISFHRLMAEAARNPVHLALTNAVMDVEEQLPLPPGALTPDDSGRVHAAHREILDAVIGRRPDDARAIMHAHIVDVQQRLARGDSERVLATDRAPVRTVEAS